MVSIAKMVLNQTKVKHYLHLMCIILWQQLSKKLHLHLAAVQHFLHVHVHASICNVSLLMQLVFQIQTFSNKIKMIIKLNQRRQTF